MVKGLSKVSRSRGQDGTKHGVLDDGIILAAQIRDKMKHADDDRGRAHPRF